MNGTFKARAHRLARKLNDTLDGVLPRRASVYAANASFFILLSVFPAMLLLLNLLRYLPVSAQDLTTFLDNWLPDAIAPLIDYITSELYGSGHSITLVSITALMAVWSAGRSVLGVMNGLNEVYGITDHRNYLARRGLSALYTLVLGLALVVTLGLHALGERLRSAMSPQLGGLLTVWDYLVSIRPLVVIPLLTLVFTVIYRVLPDHRVRLLRQLPGAVLAALAWEIFSDLFSLYLDTSTSYSYMYGSLVTVVAAMLWLYFCMNILFYGAAVNRFLALRHEKRSGAAKP